MIVLVWVMLVKLVCSQLFLPFIIRSIPPVPEVSIRQDKVQDSGFSCVSMRRGLRFRDVNMLHPIQEHMSP